jgi:TolA-binding protein
MTALRQGAREREMRDYLSLRREFDNVMESSLRIANVVRPSLTSALSFFTPLASAPLIEASQTHSPIVTEVQSAVPTDVQESLYRDTLDKVIAAKPPRSLQDNYAYLQAALLYRLERFDEAKAAFQEVAKKYPNSERREAAMYMTSVAALKILNQNLIPDCGAGIGNSEEDRTFRRENCQSEFWQAALLAMNQLLHAYPHGKFTSATYENRAYLLRRGGELALGAADYYRMLGHPSDVRVRLKAKEALRLLGEDVGTDAILNEIEAELADEPQAALAYAYHRIYNHAVDATYLELAKRCDYCDGDKANNYYSEWETANRKRHAAALRELERVAHFATTMMQRYPRSNYSGGFVLRVAQAQIELQNFREALPLATKALSLNLSGDMRAEALWIKGSAEHKLKDFKSARTSFTRLVNEFPKSHLIEGARRLLAMAAEDAGDWEAALGHYIALRYYDDIAYFIDVLLTPEQLAKFIERHPKLEKRDVYMYSLGLRYLRNGQWERARAIFSSIQPAKCDITRYWSGSGEPRHAKWDYSSLEATTGVCSEWLLSDIKTANDLERLERQIEMAQGDEAKAEAMYQFASYQFEGSQLLFYNPAIWGGQRHYLLSALDRENNYRSPNEAKILYDYMQTHENLARAIPTYQELARLYPNTRAAKDGLYTAAVAHRRLQDYFEYWRKLYELGLHAGERRVTFREIRSLYPNYQMPRAEQGWEPMTRTVNGGPGWSPPLPKPKPAPKPTRTQRIKRILKRVVAELHTSLQHKVETIQNRYSTLLQRCMDAIFWAVGLIGVWYGVILGLHFWKQRLALEEPDLTGLFAADVLPDNWPQSESRVEKVIGNDN